MTDREEAIDRALDALEPKAPPRKKRLTLDEILDEISQVAQDPEVGAERFRALKMLASMQTETAAFSAPLEDYEVVDRLVRLLQGAGPKLTQVAYSRAFPVGSKAILAGSRPVYKDATEEQRKAAYKITSLKVLNRKFPEAKISGVPKGFPSGASIAKKIAWCQDQALKLICERDRAQAQRAHNAMMAADATGRRDTEVPTVETLQEPEV